MALPTSGALTLANIQTEFGGTNPIGLNEYYAGGGLVPAGTSGTYGTVPSSGTISIQNFYGTTAFVPNYIEDVFSNTLYTGNGAAQTVTTGVNILNNGGMIWIKSRNTTTRNAVLTTPAGSIGQLNTNFDYSGDGTSVSSTSTTGFNINTNFTQSANFLNINTNGNSYVSWSFRKKAKFFDIVTYTGDGTNNRSITHALGTPPGLILVKRYNNQGGDWIVYHRAIGQVLQLNTANAAGAVHTPGTFGDGSATMVAPTSSTFTVGSNANISTATYVAYIFAHDAGGFGLTDTDNVISCHAYTGTGVAAGPTISLGYEPQWLLIKNASGTGNWQIVDNMRGMLTGSADQTLQANLGNVESAADYVTPTATGFQITSTSSEVNASNSIYVYMAIRRGPMKVPTSGTQVFATTPNPSDTYAGLGSTSVARSPDMMIGKSGSGSGAIFVDRLRGLGVSTAATNSLQLDSTSTAIEASGTSVRQYDWEGGNSNSLTTPRTWMFRRAPGFFDVVCYIGAGSGTVINHNLRAVPELVIIKSRSTSNSWRVAKAEPDWSAFNTQLSGSLSSNAALSQSGWILSSVTTTSAVISQNSDSSTAQNYVAYLFASCPGVSKVGNYTGNGTSQTINCGFTAGARFILIKRRNSTGDWYVWDTGRGIVSGNDPILSLNTQVAEVTTDDSIDPESTGFIVNQVAGTDINVSGGTYIYLAIA